MRSSNKSNFTIMFIVLVLCLTAFRAVPDGHAAVALKINGDSY